MDIDKPYNSVVPYSVLDPGQTYFRSLLKNLCGFVSGLILVASELTCAFYEIEQPICGVLREWLSSVSRIVQSMFKMQFFLQRMFTPVHLEHLQSSDS